MLALSVVEIFSGRRNGSSLRCAKIGIISSMAPFYGDEDQFLSVPEQCVVVQNDYHGLLTKEELAANMLR
jgi:hypothetical protein